MRHCNVHSAATYASALSRYVCHRDCAAVFALLPQPPPPTIHPTSRLLASTTFASSAFKSGLVLAKRHARHAVTRFLHRLPPTPALTLLSLLPFVWQSWYVRVFFVGGVLSFMGIVFHGYGCFMGVVFHGCCISWVLSFMSVVFHGCCLS